MQHHCHFLPERFHVIPANVDTAYLHCAHCGIIQTGNQLHQRTLGTAGSAQNAYGHASRNVQIHVFQTAFIFPLAVTEADMVEVHAAVRHRGHGICRTGNVTLLVQHFHNTLAGGTGHGDHNEHHRQHHQAGQNLNGIGHQAHQFASGQCPADDHSGTEPRYQNQTDVHAELHQRHVKCQPLFCPGKVLINVLRNAGKLLDLVFFPHKGFHHANPVQVLLCHVVQLVIGFEHPFKNGVHPCYNEVQPHTQHRNGCQIDQSQLCTQVECHCH